MRMTIVFSLFAMVALTFATAVEAQERGQRRGQRGGGMGMASRTALLRVEAVQKELELNDEQKEAINELRSGGRQRGDGGSDSADGQSRDGRGSDAQGGQRQGRGGGGRTAEQVEAEMKAVAEILTDDQVQRLTEIFVQVAGAGAFLDPVIAKKLEVSDEQMESIREIQGSMRERMMDAFSSGGGDRDAMREIFNEVRAEIEKEMLDVFSDDQKKKLEELKGEAFEMPEGALRGGRGGGRGGRTDF